jgi:putrescine transport system substrate-binding protein
VNKLVSISILTFIISNGFVLTSFADEEKILNIYNWSNYLAEDTIPNFEKETGIKVRYDTYESNEELDAKLKTKKIGYDIVVPSSNWAKTQIDRGYFQKLDKTKLPNIKNLDQSISKQLENFDSGNEYLVNWLWGYTTIGLDVEKVTKALGKTSPPNNIWELVFNPTYTKKLKSCGIAYLDSASEIFPAALHYIGKQPYSTNEADFKLAYDTLAKVRPDIKTFVSGGTIDDFANGSYCIAIAWVGDMNSARVLAKKNKHPKNIVAEFPSSGAFLFMDTMAITTNAKHPENAHKFINYILRPEVHAALTNATNFANPNKASLKFVRQELKSDPSIFLNERYVNKLIPPGSVDIKASGIMESYFERFKALQ